MVNMSTANLTTDMNGEKQSSQGGEGRRLLALPGIITVVSALITASISFAILIGITPITPDRTVTLALVIINVALILFLIMLIAPACPHRRAVFVDCSGSCHRGGHRCFRNAQSGS